MEDLNGCWRLYERSYLERLSTITMMTNLLPNLGNQTMNSIEISIHIASGTGRGFSVPRVLIISRLLHWKVSYSATKVWISYFISSPKNEHLILSYIL